mmetsp:Transcript_69493/g.226322  ORF Transcript_69493/g.226322 Transcript_69493/m.226322 type:complete len:537 (-) Transcript_69493:496-2106(-)
MGGCTSKTQVSEPRVTDQAQVFLPPPLDKTSSFCGSSPSRRPSISAAARAAGATANAISSPLRLSGRQLILRNPGKVHDVYDMEETCLGQGSYGSVLTGTHRMTKSVRAIKVICKEKTRDHSKLDREIEMMKEMDHPNVIKLFETFEDGRATYLAMEFCKGGELFGRVVEVGCLPEPDAATVAQQILRAVFYMHSKGIVHRDLKPENCVFATKEPLAKSVLKVVDFGLSCRFAPGEVLYEKVGAPFYVAPQVLAGRYNNLCDLWSTGVMVYLLLCGYAPFNGKKEAEVLTKVRLGNFVFDDKSWGHVSEDAKDLIRGLLRMDQDLRLTAKQALGHVWIRQTAPGASADSCLSSGTELVNNLRNFRSQNKLKKATLQIIAGQLDDSQLHGLREAFMALDANQDGLLSLSELNAGLERAGVHKKTEDLQLILDGVDTDGSGKIDYTEFLAAALDQLQCVTPDGCWTAFNVFDRDGDGKISVEELQHVLERDGMQEVDGGADRARALLRDADQNGDSVIDFKEFMALMSSTSTVSLVSV